MTENSGPTSPRKIPLPKNLEYDNSNNYRQPLPIIKSEEAPDDEDKRKSGKETPTNIARTSSLVDL
jgi:hypothetical protein